MTDDKSTLIDRIKTDVARAKAREAMLAAVEAAKRVTRRAKRLKDSGEMAAACDVLRSE